MSTNFDNCIQNADGSAPVTQGSQVTLKIAIINFHQYLMEFVQQQKSLSSAFPHICSLTPESFQKLGSLNEQINYVMTNQKRYQSLPVAQRINLLNKQKEWFHKAEYLKKIQLNYHLTGNKNEMTNVSESPLDTKLYNDFLQQKKIESLKIQRENLFKKFFLKKKQEENSTKQAVQSQKVKKQLPEVPEFQEEEIESIDMQFENFSYVPITVNDEKQYEDNSSSSFFDSNSTGLTESPVQNSSTTANYKSISGKSNKVQIIYNNSSEQSIPQITKSSSKKQQQSDSQSSNKILQKKFSKLEECILNLIEKIELPSQASQQIMKIANEMCLNILNNKDFFKNKSIEVISQSIVLYASQVCNYPIAIQEIVKITQEKEKSINKVYNSLINVLPKYNQTQTVQTEELIQGISSLLTLPVQVQLGSQQLYKNICINNLLNGEQQGIISASVIFVTCLLNNLNFPIQQYASALQLNNISLESCVQKILSNSKVLINNPAFFQQSTQFSQIC